MDFQITEEAKEHQTRARRLAEDFASRAWEPRPTRKSPGCSREGSRPAMCNRSPTIRTCAGAWRR